MRRRLLMLAIALATTACATGGGATSGGRSASSGSASTLKFDPSLDIDLSAMRRTATGMYIRDFLPGSGAPVVNGDRVRLRFTLNLTDGTRIEGLSTADPPFEFAVGSHQVIAGWDEGVLGMKAGGSRQLVVPPSLGYGGRRQGKIPGASVLVYNLQLVEIVK